MEKISVSNESFAGLNIAPKLLDILEKQQFRTPTPIQAQSIPPAIQGKDLMGIAQTGTGKTLAFGIPMIQRLAQSSGQMKGLVILPTRELALQVDATLKKVGSSLGLKTAILIGGEAMPKQFRALKANPHIIIATPGRLIDHLENGKLSLAQVGVLVLDEADRMLDMGFAPQIKQILDRVPKHRQTMLFSATMPNEIVNIAKSYMNLPLRVEVAPAGSAVNTVTQELFFVDRADKLGLLKNILAQYKGTVLVFSRTKHGASKISRAITQMGHTSAEIHSNKSLNQRIAALEGFKLGRYRVLVATDIAARGIDVTGIQLVVNFDLPSTAEDYVHRIGRTGRAGLQGHAISFAAPDQRGEVRGIERLIRKTLPVSKTPSVTRMPMGSIPDRADNFSKSRHSARSGQRRSYPKSGARPYVSHTSYGKAYRDRTPGTKPENQRFGAPNPARGRQHAGYKGRDFRKQGGPKILKPTRAAQNVQGYFLKSNDKNRE